MRRVAMHLLGVAADVAMAVFDASGRAMRWLDRLHDRLDAPDLSPPDPTPILPPEVQRELVARERDVADYWRLRKRAVTTPWKGQA